MKKNYLIIGLFAVLVFTGCEKKSVLENYESIKKDGIKGNSFYEKIYEFEIMHPDHLESKVDLASMNILIKNYDKAREYLERCKPLLDKTGNKKNCMDYYGLSAAISYYDRDFEKAKKYLLQIKDEKYGEKYIFLKAHIYLDSGDYETSLNLFEKGFNNHSEKAVKDDYIAYMSLLVEYKKFTESLQFLNQYFSKGKYFYGFGKMASIIYEKNEMYYESMICAYLDYEYAQDLGYDIKENFLSRISELKTNFTSKKGEQEIINAAKCIESILLGKNVFPIVNDEFPVNKYLKLKHDITVKKNFKIKSEVLSDLSFFTELPSFYYMLSFCTENKIEILEKLLSFGNNSIYSDYARKSLSNIIGIDQCDSNKLLVFSEIKFLLFDYINFGNDKSFDKLLGLFDLPDNKYLFYAMMLLKENLYNEPIKKYIKNAIENSNGKRKERLNYIILQ